jgi:small subunit ribosomal protein S16
MIRLARVGARKQPHYRVVVIEKDRARNGRSIEVVGTYNPRTEPASVELKTERIEYWTGKGAQLSETVGKLVAKYKPSEAAPAAEAPAQKIEAAPAEVAAPAPEAEATPVA